ncbi:Nif3-like dinuclear metal center hexameric protein [Bacteroidales bacterium OttesenSCG-928-I21]|nr:Nif3-like dinuclear metal center hexameric protein [Bacteroidales bacterium OttesenSCG-928-I21]
MLAKEVYVNLEDYFIKPEMSDEFYQYMTELDSFLCDNFKKRSIGLVCDFTETINHVFTAVFPTDKVLGKVLEKPEKSMLFTHHACNWDLRKSPTGFYNMNAGFLAALREKQISVYCLHTPLDNYSEYSTSKTLAEKLNIKITKAFVNYSGAICGVIGKTKCNTVNELQKIYLQAIGHSTSLYPYGDDEIKDGMVAVVAGGGNNMFVLPELRENNIGTFITGITLKNEVSAEAHEYAAKNGINILGGTHYSSEKFACIAMCNYFEKLGLPAEFIGDEPCFEDM